MFVVVMGCGRVGSSLAAALVRLGNDVAVIDRDPSASCAWAPPTSRERRSSEWDSTGTYSSGPESNAPTRSPRCPPVTIPTSSPRVWRARHSASSGSSPASTTPSARRSTNASASPTVATSRGPRTGSCTRSSATPRPPAGGTPTGTVAVAEVSLNEEWIGRNVTELEAATQSRVAFIIRFGAGVLPDRKTVLQADDQVYIAAVSGTVAEALALAASPPAEND